MKRLTVVAMVLAAGLAAAIRRTTTTATINGTIYDGTDHVLGWVRHRQRGTARRRRSVVGGRGPATMTMNVPR